MRQSENKEILEKKDMNIKTITGYQKACWTWGKGSNIKTPVIVRTTGHMIQESVQNYH